jgi:hypothetical protein
LKLLIQVELSSHKIDNFLPRKMIQFKERKTAFSVIPRNYFSFGHRRLIHRPIYQAGN